MQEVARSHLELHHGGGADDGGRNERPDFTQPMASCVAVSPCFSATPTYSDTASLARDLLKRSIYPGTRDLSCCPPIEVAWLVG